MAERKWTLVIVPPGSGASKAVEVSQALLKIAAGFGVVLALSALLLGYATVSRSVSLQRSSALQRENANLAEQIGQLNGKLDLLSDTLRLIAQRDAKIRLMANLEPNDPQVQQAGIGGPAPAGAAVPPIATVLARRAEEVRVDLAGLIRRANLLAFSFKEAGDSISAHRDRLVAMPSIMPTSGWLTSAFASMREHPILHYARPHERIDVQAPLGAPIQSPGAGVVTSTGWETGYGNTVEIDHGYGITTKFAHCSKILVRQGQRVKRGDLIAQVGNTGLATGPHLHYEVHVHGQPVDPLRYVLPQVVVD
jgi:murein DD-endopeptidase MepM/ murein hydrolase activator NlpD